MKSEDIRERLENPFDGLADLGSYFCHTLDLLPPSRSEIIKGLASLAAYNIIQETAKGITLSADLGGLALDLKVVRAHVHFAVKQLNRTGEVESLRYWALQGKSGAMLLWYEVDGDVVFRVVTPAVFHELIIRLLKIQPTPAAQPPAVPTAAPAGGKTVRYEPPKTKQKSAAGRMLTSFLIGLLTIAVGLFTTGYLTYTPGKGVAVAAVDATIAPTDVAEVNGSTASAAELDMQDIQVEDVTVVKTSEYTTSVFGRLINNGVSAVSYVTLKVDLLDSTGNVIQTVDGWSVTNGIAAGGEGYFMAEAYELTELPASATATITYAAPAEVDSTVTLAEVRGKQVTPIEYYAEIIGDAFNTSDQPVEILSVTGILLDANGHVIGMGRSDDYDIALRSGEYMPVKVSVSASTEIAARAADSLLLVETAPVSTVTDPPLALSTENEIFRTPDGFFYISEMLNNSDQTLRVEGLVVAFYDAEGNLLDVARSLDTRFIEPGAISPFIVEGFNRLNLEENQGVSPASYLIVVPQMATTTLDAGLLTLDTEVINTNQYLPDQWYLVHGNVINNTSEMIAYGTVTVNLRDPATGKLKSTYYYPFSGLASGASTEFVVYLPLPPGVDPAVMTQEIRAVGTP